MQPQSHLVFASSEQNGSVGLQPLHNRATSIIDY